MKHLSSEQLSSVVAGIRIPEDGHLRECATCAQEVERMKTVLNLFRGSVWEWADNLDHSRAKPAHAPRRTPMAWVVAAAVLAAAVAIPMYQDSRTQELKAQALRDAQLLDDVNAQLSRSGPLAMDPLMRLMAFPESGSGTSSDIETETKKENGGVQ